MHIKLLIMYLLGEPFFDFWWFNKGYVIIKSLPEVARMKVKWKKVYSNSFSLLNSFQENSMKLIKYKSQNWFVSWVQVGVFIEQRLWKWTLKILYMQTEHTFIILNFIVILFQKKYRRASLLRPVLFAQMSPEAPLILYRYVAGFKLAWIIFFK